MILEGNMPLVSVLCQAFNHEKYISQCLQGILMQKTDFVFELLVHDDASTDKTVTVIQSFEEKFPKILKPIYQNINQYSQGKKVLSGIQLPRALGKYIAICEADDYWTDPYKLQKQVDFLEKNPEYGLAHGDCHFLYPATGILHKNANRSLNNSIEYSKEDLFAQLINSTYRIRTATVVYRKDLLHNIVQNNIDFVMGDTPKWLDLSQITKFKYFDEVFAVYRISENSASRPADKVKALRFQLSMAEMRVYYSYKYNYPIRLKLKYRYNKSLIEYKTHIPEYQEHFSLFPLSFIQNWIVKVGKLRIAQKYKSILAAFRFK